MYAITDAGYRAIASPDDLQSDETAVDELPESLLSTLRATETRLQRDAMLRACDWAQMPDSPLDVSQRAAWGVYRQALRDVPAQAGFPETINWPTAP